MKYEQELKEIIRECFFMDNPQRSKIDLEILEECINEDFEEQLGNGTYEAIIQTIDRLIMAGKTKDDALFIVKQMMVSMFNHN